ncbi:hypothetical protein BDF22DRAFT_47027 [Syncephalis plumigaleata]|nr:hypothetical protein BDF22DRAFT_47027 [Syncephalis plumigaleata]
MWHLRAVAYLAIFTVSPVLALISTSLDTSTRQHDDQRQDTAAHLDRKQASTVHLDRRSVVSRLARWSRNAYNKEVDAVVDGMREPLLKEMEEGITNGGIEFAQTLPEKLQDIL